VSEEEGSFAQLEALIFASEEPVSVNTLRRVLPLTPTQIATAVAHINADLAKCGRPYQIVEAAGGYRFRTLPQFGELIAGLAPERKLRLSRASLDCLALIAYRQPISRPEIEELRSVDCGAVLRGLLDRGMLRVAGRRDAPGRPALYATTSLFLETFGLASLRDLPSLQDLLENAASKGTENAKPEGEGEDAAQTVDLALNSPIDTVEPSVMATTGEAIETSDAPLAAQDSLEQELLGRESRAPDLETDGAVPEIPPSEGVALVETDRFDDDEDRVPPTATREASEDE